MTTEPTPEPLFRDPLELPEPGHKFRMPDGSDVVVSSAAQDHTGVRVNGVYVYRVPEPSDPELIDRPLR